MNIDERELATYKSLARQVDLVSAIFEYEYWGDYSHYEASEKMVQLARNKFFYSGGIPLIRLGRARGCFGDGSKDFRRHWWLEYENWIIDFTLPCLHKIGITPMTDKALIPLPVSALLVKDDLPMWWRYQ